MGGNSKIEIPLQFTPNFFVSNIYYKLYYFNLNSEIGSLNQVTQFQNINDKPFWLFL